MKVAAQKALGRHFLRLARADGRLLNPRESLQVAGLTDGDCIAAIVQQPKIAATHSAFAVWCVGGCEVLTWGDPKAGGDSTAVRDDLKNVQDVCATGSAFAAKLADGSVITWGDPETGGDCTPIAGQLRNVRQLHASFGAFAAILTDGTVVTWGDPMFGGDSTAVQGQLKHVRYIHATDGAFAAVLADGSVVTWGDPEEGGESTGVQDQLRNVQQIYATGGAFAAISADGTIVTWGAEEHGGDCSTVRAKLQHVREIHATSVAFVAILVDGTVVAWGSPEVVGDAAVVQLPEQLRKGEQIYAGRYVLATILGDTAMVSWDLVTGGCSTLIFENQQNFQELCSTSGSFAAILADGTLIADPLVLPYQADPNGPCTAQQLRSTWNAFAAILADGSLVTWGLPQYGGDSTAVQGQLIYL